MTAEVTSKAYKVRCDELNQASFWGVPEPSVALPSLTPKKANQSNQCSSAECNAYKGILHFLHLALEHGKNGASSAFAPFCTFCTNSLAPTNEDIKHFVKLRGSTISLKLTSFRLADQPVLVLWIRIQAEAV